MRYNESEQFPKHTKLYIICSIVNEKGEEVNRQEKFASESIFEDPHNRLFEKFLHKDCLNDEDQEYGLLVDGKCTIRCRLYYYPSSEVITKSELYFTNRLLEIGLKSYEKLFESKEHSDVKLIVQNEELYVHKCILAAKSRVFSAMFEHDMRESTENVVKITDVKVGVMKELLRFIYASSISNIYENPKDLLAAADKYEIQELKNLCERELLQRLNTNNAGEFLALADMYKANELKIKATEFIIRHQSSINEENLKKVTKSVSYSMFELIDLFKEVNNLFKIKYSY